MSITEQQEKIQLVEKLLKDGHIDFQQAIKLLQVEKEYIYYPNVNVPWTYTSPITALEPTYITSQ